MNEQDITDAQWAQIEREEQHRRIAEEFREWIEENYPQFYKHRREPMPLVKDMIQSKFLRKEDFDEDQVCTIRDVKLEDVGQQESAEQRWVLYFKERDKGMVLNVTTIRVLEAAYGGDSDHWIGNKVMVYVDPNVSFGGKVVGGLRLRTPKRQAVQAPKPPIDKDFDDSIPF